MNRGIRSIVTSIQEVEHSSMAPGSGVFHLLTLSVEAPATGWVGFGIAESGAMKGADIVYFEAASSNLVDAFAIDYAKPQPDACQDWYLLTGESDGSMIRFTAQRVLDTSDPSDWPITVDTEPMNPNRYIAAWGNSAEISYHGPENRLLGSIRFHSDYGDESQHHEVFFFAAKFRAVSIYRVGHLSLRASLC